MNRQRAPNWCLNDLCRKRTATKEVAPKWSRKKDMIPVVTQDSQCLLTIANTPKVSLFSNLSADAKPIATPSRRYNQEDRAFIQENIEKQLKDKIIQLSSSPWRAQVVVITDEFKRQKKRTCVDYSQTINIFTDLDAYPLPRIDDMINELAKYSGFSTF